VRYTNLDRRSSFECVSPRLLLLPPLFFLLLLLLALLHLRAGVDAAVSDVVETPRGYLSTSDDRSALSFSVSPFFEEGVLPFPFRIKHKLSVRLSISLAPRDSANLPLRIPLPARSLTRPHVHSSTSTSSLSLPLLLTHSLSLSLSLSPCNTRKMAALLYSRAGQCLPTRALTRTRATAGIARRRGYPDALATRFRCTQKGEPRETIAHRRGPSPRSIWCMKRESLVYDGIYAAPRTFYN